MKIKNKDNYKSIAWACVIVAVFTITMAGIIYLLTGSKATVSTTGNNVVKSGIRCGAGNVDGGFFASDLALDEKHTVSFTFDDGYVEKVFYTYNATIKNEGAAKDELSRLRFKYGQYMDNAGKNISELSPSFIDKNNEIAVSLYFTKDNFTSAVSNIVFLGADDLRRVGNNQRNNLIQIYEEKGFTCKSEN